ncbi:MAG: hypothetical protein HFACDABA_02473 [Anaerolineales bacterium]|nr:hypothetical protein [Anaerolineales bacterium]
MYGIITLEITVLTQGLEEGIAVVLKMESETA